jgi:uracil-DNA glycosylase family protein
MEERPVEERLKEVEQRAKQCTACHLATTRTQVVFGEGNPRSPLVLVGEGPGEQEDLTGRPFVGRAGALLDRALREAGMGRQHVYICNIIKCRAYTIENGRARNRPPNQEEIAACAPWLDAQLTLIQPLVIVCLGGPAASVIIHKNFRITQERGQWFSSRWAPAAIATLHPAYILRQAGPTFDRAYALLVEDLKAARARVIELKQQQRQQQPLIPQPVRSSNLACSDTNCVSKVCFFTPSCRFPLWAGGTEPMHGSPRAAGGTSRRGAIDELCWRNWHECLDARRICPPPFSSIQTAPSRKLGESSERQIPLWRDKKRSDESGLLRFCSVPAWHWRKSRPRSPWRPSASTCKRDRPLAA